MTDLARATAKGVAMGLSVTTGVFLLFALRGESAGALPVILGVIFGLICAYLARGSADARDRR